MPLQRGSDIDQCIERESRRCAAPQIADPRLALSAQACRFLLRPVIEGQQGLDALDQRYADLLIGCVRKTAGVARCHWRIIPCLEWTRICFLNGRK